MEPALQAGTDVPEARAYLSIDESGDFTYHPSERALLEGYEYVGEAACIFDRNGTQYRLVLDKDRRLRIGPGLGMVEPHWLRQAWITALKSHAPAHRLRRHLPADLGALTADLFEVLALEQGVPMQGIPESGGSWVLEAAGNTETLPTLAEVDRHAAALHEHDSLRARDPYGRTYRLEWRHPRLIPGRPFYVEV